jgi:hypothetical protein
MDSCESHICDDKNTSAAVLDIRLIVEAHDVFWLQVAMTPGSFVGVMQFPDGPGEAKELRETPLEIP